MPTIEELNKIREVTNKEIELETNDLYDKGEIYEREDINL